MTRNGGAETVSLGKADWVGLIAIGLTIIGIIAGSIAWLYSTISAEVQSVSEDVKAVAQLADENESRITKREANAFTSQDANELLLAMSKLSMQVAQQRKELDENAKQRKELVDQLKSFESKFNVLPADVLKEIKALRAELKQQ